MNPPKIKAINEFLKSVGNPSLFNVQLVGLTKEVKVAKGLLFYSYRCHFIKCSKPHLIIIPAVSSNLGNANKLNQDFLPWINKHYKSVS